MNAAPQPDVTLESFEAGTILHRYYSKELLASERARTSFVLPDQLAG